MPRNLHKVRQHRRLVVIDMLSVLMSQDWMCFLLTGTMSKTQGMDVPSSFTACCSHR